MPINFSSNVLNKSKIYILLIKRDTGHDKSCAPYKITLHERENVPY